MKNVFIFLLLFIGTMVYAQEQEFPTCVKDAFKTKFPGAKNVYLYQEEARCRIEFDLLADSYIVFYSKNGDWLETGKIISDMDIPALVASAVKKKYPNCQISFAEMVVNKKGENFYRINSFNCDADLLINVNEDGKIISTEEKTVPKPATSETPVEEGDSQK